MFSYNYTKNNSLNSIDIFTNDEIPSTRRVVMQLHALSADPDSQVSMVHEHSIFIF